MGDLGTFLSLIGRRRGWMLAGCAMALTSALSGIGLLAIAGWYVGSAALAAGTGLVIFGISVRVLLRGFAVARVLGRYAERLVTHEATFRLLADIRLWFLECAIPLAPLKLGGFRGGDLLSRIVADVDALDGLYLRLLVPSVVAVVVAGAMLVLLGAFSPVIAVTVLALLATAGLVVPAWMRRIGDASGAESVTAAADARTALVDMTQGMAELTAHGALDRQLAIIAEAEERLIEAQRHQAALAGLSAALSGLAANLAMLAVLWLGSQAIAAGGMAPAVLAMLVLAVIASFEAVSPLAAAYQLVGRIRTAAGRVLEIAHAPPSVTEPEAPTQMPTGNDIALVGLTARHEAAIAPALDRIDLSITEGARLALVGPSGSGKSSLLTVLLRFLDYESGTLSIGGVDAKTLSGDALRGRMAMLSQASQIFAASLRDNLLIGRPDATDSDLTAALENAGLGDFFTDLPQGLDTWLGEGGVAVSGGQARRVALARVYLKDAPILLLDEPTEGLDAESERDVLARLAKIMIGRTTIMVTHHPAGLDLMDRVIRLEAGRLVE